MRKLGVYIIATSIYQLTGVFEGQNAQSFFDSFITLFIEDGYDYRSLGIVIGKSDSGMNFLPHIKGRCLASVDGMPAVEVQLLNYSSEFSEKLLIKSSVKPDDEIPIPEKLCTVLMDKAADRSIVLGIGADDLSYVRWNISNNNAIVISYNGLIKPVAGYILYLIAQAKYLGRDIVIADNANKVFGQLSGTICDYLCEADSDFDDKFTECLMDYKGKLFVITCFNRIICSSAPSKTAGQSSKRCRITTIFFTARTSAR